MTRKLAVSARTLQRRLSLENTSYQQELTRTRADLALHYLLSTTLRAAEIAYLLGYDDSNSFYRAFRTWTGSTPDTVRAAGTAGLLDEPDARAPQSVSGGAAPSS